VELQALTGSVAFAVTQTAAAGGVPYVVALAPIIAAGRGRTMIA